MAEGRKEMYYASFYPYGTNIANVFDILAFESKQERDNWYTKNQFDCEGFQQAERLSARQVYKIAGRKFELQNVYDSNYYRICSGLKTE